MVGGGSRPNLIATGASASAPSVPIRWVAALTKTRLATFVQPTKVCNFNLYCMAEIQLTVAVLLLLVSRDNARTLLSLPPTSESE